MGRQYDLRELETVLAELADSDIAVHSARFFKTGKGQYGEGDRFMGIRVPTLRKLIPGCRELLFFELVELLQSPFHEKRLLAALILVDRFKRGSAQEQEEIYTLYLEQIGRGINNWDIIDTSCPHILGAWLYERDKSILYDLAGSQNLWQRRAAMLACFYFIRCNDFTDALRIAEKLRTDQQDLIHKAVGWMLRYAIERFEPEKRKYYMKKKLYEKKATNFSRDIF